MLDSGMLLYNGFIRRTGASTNSEFPLLLFVDLQVLNNNGQPLHKTQLVQVIFILLTLVLYSNNNNHRRMGQKGVVSMNLHVVLITNIRCIDIQLNLLSLSAFRFAYIFI